MSEDNELKGLIELGWFGEMPSVPEKAPAKQRTDKQRLTELIQLCKDLREQNKQLRDEVARLRGALQTYAECSDGCTCGDGWSHDPAKAALTPQAGKGGGEMSSEHQECELCGDVTQEMFLHAKCHIAAPLQVSLHDGEIVLRCYIPDCAREVARFKIQVSK